MHVLLLLCIQYTIRNWSTLHMIELCTSLCSVLCLAYLHEMTFPVYYIKLHVLQELANIPTNTEWIYYDYTIGTLLYTYMQQATYQNSFMSRKSHIGRGVHASGKWTSGKVHASGNASRENERRERGLWVGARWTSGVGFMHRKMNVGRSVHALGLICTTDSVLLGHQRKHLAMSL